MTFFCEINNRSFFSVLGDFFPAAHVSRNVLEKLTRLTYQRIFSH